MDAFNEYVKLDRSNEIIIRVRNMITFYVSEIEDMFMSKDYDYSFYERIDRKMKDNHIIGDDGRGFNNLKDLANYLADEEERLDSMPSEPISDDEWERWKENPDIYFATNYGISDIDEFMETSNRRYREYEKRLGLKSDADDGNEDSRV